MFRALQLLFQNIPQGWEYRSWFYEERTPTTVRAVSDMGDEAIRMKGSNVNKYIINGEDWAASSIPPALITLFPTNISNFQPQHKPYFLLQDTPGTVGSKLSEIVGLHIIDSVTSSAESRVRTLRHSKETLKTEIVGLKHKIQSFAELDEMQTILTAAQSTKELIEHQQRSIDSITPLILQMQSKIHVLESQNRTINEIEPYLNSVVETLNAAVDASESRFLRQAIGSYVMYDAEIKKADTIIEALEPVYNEVHDIIVELFVVMAECTALQTRTDNMQRVLDLITANANLTLQYEIEIQEAINNIGYCPLCGDMKGVADENTDIGGLAHTCEQSSEESGQLCGNTSRQSTLPVRHRTRKRVPIHSAAGGLN
jgi:hypothetical protein